MSNVIDYVKWRGDIGFDVAPFNEIDGLIFAELSYIPFDDIIDDNEKGEALINLSKKFFSKPKEEIKMGAIIPEKEIRELFELSANSNRYSNVKLKKYINIFSKEEEKQFCGMCFLIDKENMCIAFRGTDDSLVGWKEDFNMSFNLSIPSQIEALNFVNLVGAKTRRNIYVCGHSKGGNLATYAGIFANPRVKKKINGIYDYDGPGFRKDFVEQIADNEIKDKINKYVPQASIIGMIYNSVNCPKLLKSDAKGLYQHDAFRWNIIGKEFITVENLEKSSTEFHNLLNAWTGSMSSEERSEFVEALYKLVTVNENATLSDIASDKFKFILGVLKADGHTKKIFISAINRLIKEKYFKKKSNKNNL